MVSSDRARGKGHTLKHKSFHLNITKQFFTVRVTEHQNKLSIEVVESPPLEILENHLDTVLGREL